MESKRLLELLAYASVCFDKCTNPFERMHLLKKNITAQECFELSTEIASLIEDSLNEVYYLNEVNDAIKKSKKEFEETQQ